MAWLPALGEDERFSLFRRRGNKGGRANGGECRVGLINCANDFIVMAEDACLPSLFEFGLLLFRLRRGGLICLSSWPPRFHPSHRVACRGSFRNHFLGNAIGTGTFISPPPLSWA
mmetsp:Transcript_38166/g.62413  ORF Transcript_38166/g.62413 Transcript_38166/m.62413 type:complete len:115 (+) Transcript_38166:894-1238(+)